MKAYSNVYSCAEYVYNYFKEKNIDCSATALQHILFRVYVDYAVKANKKLFEENFCAWDKGFVIPELYNCYHISFAPYFKTDNYQPLTDKGVQQQLELMANQFDQFVEHGRFGMFMMDDVDTKIQSHELYKIHKCKDIMEILSTSHCVVSFEEVRKYYSNPQNYKALLECYNCKIDPSSYQHKYAEYSNELEEFFSFAKEALGKKLGDDMEK